jgi:hypothetical protein
MWSVRQLAIFVSGAIAGSANTECGAFTRYSEPGYEVCSDDHGCYKIQIRCPDGYTSSFENSLKCKGGEWKGIGSNEVISCDPDYKACDYEGLPATGEDVIANCNHNGCAYSCADGSEVNAASAKCDTMFGEWSFAGWGNDKPGKIRCAGFPKPPKEPKDKDHCEAFTNFDAESVDVVSCDNKRCSFQCKDGFHSITSDTAKCRAAGYWKLNNGADTVRCFGNDNTWMNEWKTEEMDFDPPFKCDPKDLRRVTLTNCYDVDGDGSITNCDVMCRGIKIDDVRCINYRPKWSNEYFDC